MCLAFPALRAICWRAASATFSGVKPNLSEQRLQRRRGAEAVHPDLGAGKADVALPADGRRLLDRDPRRDLGRQHLVRGRPRPAARTARSSASRPPAPARLRRSAPRRPGRKATPRCRCRSGSPRAARRPAGRPARRRRAPHPRPGRSVCRSSVGRVWRDRIRQTGCSLHRQRSRARPRRPRWRRRGGW